MAEEENKSLNSVVSEEDEAELKKRREQIRNKIKEKREKQNAKEELRIERKRVFPEDSTEVEKTEMKKSIEIVFPNKLDT